MPDKIRKMDEGGSHADNGDNNVAKMHNEPEYNSGEIDIHAAWRYTRIEAEAGGAAFSEALRRAG